MLRIFVDAGSLNQLRALQQRMRQFQRALQNRRKAHQEIKRRMIYSWTVNFNSEGGMYGAWKSLAASTLLERRSLGFPDGPILVRTGTLRAGFFGQVRQGKVSQDATEWNFQRKPEYLFTHQFGGRFGRSRVPARPMWGLNAKDEAMAERVLEEYVNEVIARYFR